LEIQDTYKTIAQPSEEILYKEKNKVFWLRFSITSEDEVKPISFKKQHPNAGHFCYAYQIGTNTTTYRANDDGEPNNSAGMHQFTDKYSRLELLMSY
jgi:putative IMPACT (imprinted ancient) family translation regulator